MKYEGNPKHKDPFQPGRRGSQCPRDIDPRAAQRMLLNSVLVGSARYNVHEGQAFCAREHGQGHWHGYPVSWQEVPPQVRAEWLKKGLVKRSQIRRGW